MTSPKVHTCPERESDGYCFQLGKQCPFSHPTHCEDYILMEIQRGNFYHPHHRGATMIVGGEISPTLREGESE